MNNEIVLIGAGGHGLVIADILKAEGKDILCFKDQYISATTHGGYPVRKLEEDLEENVSNAYIISIGNNEVRKKVNEKFPLNYATAIHPSAIIASSATIEKGTVIMPLVCVNAAAAIGAHCILNTGCIVEHECVIESFVHLSPRVALAGNVKVGEGSHIGIGAVVLPGVSIGKWCTVGAGAVVIEDIPDHSIVVGVPAKPIIK